MDEWSGPAELSSHSQSLRDGKEERGSRSATLREQLREILRHEVLPRLLSRRLEPSTASPPGDAEALAWLLIEGRLGDAREALAARLAAGVKPERVMVDDIGGAARYLGEMWESDECDFVEVTLAVGSLRTIAREIAPDAAPHASPAPAIVLSAAPGESHELAVEVVAGLFRLAGWRAEGVAAGEAIRAVAREAFDVAGFSLSCERYAARLAQAIRQTRAASRNAKLRILVGGPALAMQPELARQLGADYAAPAGEDASRLPNALRRTLQL